ncbi:MAG: fasciclin domain-containing protein [Candidatus Aenigmatarchaeota archaeon]
MCALLKKKMRNVAETIQHKRSLSTLYKAIDKAGLGDVLSVGGPYTIFAPNNKAFRQVPEKDLEALLKDKRKLGNVLKYHVIRGKMMAKDVIKKDSLETFLGKMIDIDTKDGVKVNDAKIIKTDIDCSNGVIHIIDKPLLPE